MEEDKTYTLMLADGTVVENTTLNGDNYIVAGIVNPEIFADNCAPLVIDDGEHQETHEHAELVQAVPHGDETWIAFRDLSAAEIRERKLRADIEYIAMMADVELED